jgi:hypothetical protein
MPTITLSVKVNGDHQLELIRNLLEPIFEGLKVDIKIERMIRGWVQLTASGEDEHVALRYLTQKMGAAPVLLKNIDKFSTIKGYISSFDKRKLYVDIGISSPKSVDVAIPLRYLRAQLVDGRKMPLREITDLFCFFENLPLMIKITGTERRKNQVKAILSERQLTLYRNWTKTLLDRLVVLGASSSEVEYAIRRGRCNRDVVNVEFIGMLEHAIVCKLGTDAVGLIPKVGRKLANANFAVFNPKRVLNLIGDYTVL